MRIFSYAWQVLRIKITLLTSGSFFTLLLLSCTGDNSPHRNKRLERLGKQLCKVVPKIGPAYIKLGQFLSTRPDLIGAILSTELSILQDRMPAFPYKHVQRTVHKELGATIHELFIEFGQEPVAAASISQVHKAVTINGEVVAVKVLRPKIERRFAQDLALLKFLATIGEYISAEMRRLKVVAVVETLRQLVLTELDLRFEGAAAGKLAENLQEDDGVHIPKVYWEYTNRRVITLEWVNGIPIHNREALKRQGHDLHDLAKKIAVTFFNQAYRDGFFHADIHPGNILVNRKGEICFLDFGIMGTLAITDRTFIAEILHGFITKDYDKVADVHFAAGYVPAHQDRNLFALVCRSIGEPIIGLPVNRISIATLLRQLFEVTREFEMETQTQLLMLQKTMVTIEGAGYLLYPEVNMWQLAEPWITEWAEQNLGCHKKLRDVSGEIMALARKLNTAITSVATWQEDRKAKLKAMRNKVRAVIVSFLCGVGASVVLIWLQD